MRVYLILIVLIIASCGNKESNQAEMSEIDLLNENVRSQPNDPEVYVERAKYYRDSRDFDAAISDVKRSLVLDSSVADVFLLEGKLNNAIGQSAKAKFSFLEAIEKDPNHIEARLELAQFYGGVTNFEKAVEYVNEVLKIDQNYARAYFIKGLLYRKGGVDSLAISSIQTAIELDGETIEPFIYLGDIYGERNNPLAVEYYKSALDINPTNQQCIYALAYFYQNNENDREAINLYKRLLELDPKNFLAEYNIGYVFLQNLEKPDSAAYHFSNVLKYSPNYFQAYYNRGYAYELMENYPEARLDYKAALTLSNNYPLAIEGLNRLDAIQK